MVLNGIDVFVRVVQAGSFAAAARDLGMPTTTVSARIARLEERLGVTLIQRSTRRMHVTEAGQAYFGHCVEALNALEAGESQLAAAGSEPSGLLRITAPSDIAGTVLPALCERFLEHYPRADIDLVVTNRQVDLIGEGVDLAVRAGPMRDSTMLSRKFVSGSLGLWASSDYLGRHGMPASLEDLARHQIIRFSRMPESFRLVAGGHSYTLPERSRISADDLQTIRAFVQRGAGIGLLPDFNAVTPDAPLVRVLPQFGTEPAPVFFVYPAQRFLTLNVRAFMDLAREPA
ncbi:LysR family transcriptional regulator [Devosia sp. ZB163]|uniref:LysR family transcriptional regulator n=1 Tax=Devosia sp. ZB163 TaxID=3025938 RepID=UPI00235E3B42|nr:LysR family transcriptional regulator [Devosia sp. ZB163]MDC9823659.1 LysR family transcriptional regulator [Devosia sp. ZB163]